MPAFGQRGGYWGRRRAGDRYKSCQGHRGKVRVGVHKRTVSMERAPNSQPNPQEGGSGSLPLTESKTCPKQEWYAYPFLQELFLVNEGGKRSENGQADRD